MVARHGSGLHADRAAPGYRAGGERDRGESRATVAFFAATGAMTNLAFGVWFLSMQ